MKSKTIHIISFNVPYPADYGGVIDVFYRIKALHGLGISVILHCMDYGRGEQEELNKYCSEVYYYKRKKNIALFFSSQPYIVASRRNEKLLDRLLKDEHPIWFEGLHSAAFLNHEALQSRIKLLRCHNIEHEYYLGLARALKLNYKKVYYISEARKLRAFEPVLSHAQALFCISDSDCEYFRRYNVPVKLLPAFVEDNLYPALKRKMENFALYHGNLDVIENVLAVKFLVKVFEGLDLKLTIAGRCSNNKVFKALQSHENISWRLNPEDEELHQLVLNARVNCLPTFQATGIKLKLIKALGQGNLVLVNSKMVEGNTLGEYCHVANGIDEWRRALVKSFKQNLNTNDLELRRKKVQDLFDNRKNASLLMEWLAEVPK